MSLTNFLAWLWPVLIWIWVLGGLPEIALRALTKGKFSWLSFWAHIIFFYVLVIARFIKYIWYRIQTFRHRGKAQPGKRLIPVERPFDYLARYNLKPAEIVLAHKGNQATKIDLAKYHTLLAGSTGYGKTNIINLILIQLFGKGRLFTDAFEVYLFDLKGDQESDYLHMWAPLCKKYISFDTEGGIETAIRVLSELAETVHSKAKGKHIIVIIDEVAAITSQVHDRGTRRWATATLVSLAQKLRSRGTLVLATQHPRSDTIDTPIRSNLDRKVGLHTDNRDQFRLIFGQAPPEGITPQDFAPGQFLLRDPGRRGMAAGQAMLVELPRDIDQVVFAALQARGIKDERLQLLDTLTQNKKPGASIEGDQKIYKASQAAGIIIKLPVIMATKRNFANAGAFEPPTSKGQPYLLKVSYEQAMELTKKYIAQGRWEQDPDPFVGAV